jgi:hypothetical protein
MWSPNFFKAADWCKSSLEKMGLKNVKLEDWEPMGIGYKVKKYYIHQLSPNFNQIIGQPKTWSPGTKGIIKSKVIYFDSLSESELLKYKGKLQGTIILTSGLLDPNTGTVLNSVPIISRLEDSSLLRLSEYKPAVRDTSRQNARRGRGNRNISRAIKFFMDEGASALIDASARPYGTVPGGMASLPFTGDTTRIASWNPQAPETLPQFNISMEQYNTMIRQIRYGEDVTMELFLDAEFSKPVKGLNIIGEIPGTDLKDEIVMIGAHVDGFSFNNGTLDNGCGVAIMMEAMRILQSLEIKPRRTIRIGIWGGEEEGLFGSRAYVEQHLKNKQEKHSVYFNVDNGIGRIRGIYLQENANALPVMKKWVEELNDPKTSTISLRNTGSTDHVSFDRAGLPGFQFIQDPMDYGRVYHSNMDLFERISENDLKENSYILATFAYLAAMNEIEFPKK